MLLRLAPVARYVDDARPLLELPLENPVLGGLEVAQRVALAAHDVAVELSDRVPRRELGHEAVRGRDELQGVYALLPRVVVVDAPLEVALDVGQAEEGRRPDVVQTRHSGERHLARGGGLPPRFL